MTITPVPGDDLDSRLELVAIKPEPLQIEIAGAENVIANLKSINTEKISLADVLVIPS